MKKYFALGLIACVCLIAVACEVDLGAVSENSLRIINSSGTVAHHGEGFVTDEGVTMPASIVYGGVVYLPVPLLNLEPGLDILFEGDTGTVTIMGQASRFQHVFRDTISRRTDENGNIWTFGSLHRTNTDYLFIEDADRGYARAHRLASMRAIEWYTTHVIFASVTETEEELYRIRLVHLTYTNPQGDGETLFEAEVRLSGTGEPIIHDGVLYFIADIDSEWIHFPNLGIFKASAQTEEPVLLYTVYNERGMFTPFVHLQGVWGGELRFTVNRFDDWLGVQSFEGSTEHRIDIRGE